MLARLALAVLLATAALTADAPTPPDAAAIIGAAIAAQIKP